MESAPPVTLVILLPISDCVQTSLVSFEGLFGRGMVLSFKLGFHFARIKVCSLYLFIPY